MRRFRFSLITAQIFNKLPTVQEKRDQSSRSALIQSGCWLPWSRACWGTMVPGVGVQLRMFQSSSSWFSLSNVPLPASQTCFDLLIFFFDLKPERPVMEHWLECALLSGTSQDCGRLVQAPPP